MTDTEAEESTLILPDTKKMKSQVIVKHEKERTKRQLHFAREENDILVKIEVHCIPGKLLLLMFKNRFTY